MQSRRNLAITGSVLLLHAGMLWAFQSGLVRRAAELVIPIEILAELVEPEPPKPIEPAPQPKPKLSKPLEAVKPRVVHKPPPVMPAAPVPLAITSPSPAPAAPAPAPAPAVAVAPPSAPVAPVQAAAVIQPAPVVSLPTSNADYLQNPKPAYPPLSRRLREQGMVIVRVLIGADGAAEQARINQSSGYDRLDQTALATVQRWRYVPGKQGGVPVAMWFNVPINFSLE